MHFLSLSILLLSTFPLLLLAQAEVNQIALDQARQQVVTGLQQTGQALGEVATIAEATNNPSVASLSSIATEELALTTSGVSTIAQNLQQGLDPNAGGTNPQGTVAAGLIAMNATVGVMGLAVANPDERLTAAITSAQEGTALALQGGQGVAAAGAAQIDLAAVDPKANATALVDPALDANATTAIVDAGNATAAVAANGTEQILDPALAPAANDSAPATIEQPQATAAVAPPPPSAADVPAYQNVAVKVDYPTRSRIIKRSRLSPAADGVTADSYKAAAYEIDNTKDKKQMRRRARRSVFLRRSLFDFPSEEKVVRRKVEKGWGGAYGTVVDDLHAD